MFMETYLAHPSKHCSNLKQAETSHYSFKQNKRGKEENMKKFSSFPDLLYVFNN